MQVYPGVTGGEKKVESLLSIKELQTAFDTDKGRTVSVDQVSFDLQPGETLAVVGESGSGKSVTALSIMRLLGKRGRIVHGQIQFDGRDLAALDEKAMRQMRGNRISMVFQEPMTALNPVLTIGYQLVEAIRLHTPLSKKQARELAAQMLLKVGLAEPERLMRQYPFSLSGGMRQRVAIAMALVCKPRLLIADEPTTALDVTVQAQIMRLMKQLCDETGTAILLITHDLGVVAEMADRVVVMYAGQVVESADVFTLFDRTRHPYTQGLMQSVPDVEAEQEQLVSIPGAIPAHYDHLQGCRFNNRCAYATERCRREQPELADTGDGHLSRCFEWKRLVQQRREGMQ